MLPRLEDYFGLPYAFGKLDQVGVPDFEAGAMENAGLITFREVALLLDPATAPLPVQKRVAEVITHELAHQWFGNLVTMAWWDDLWLNEAFATWMAYKIVDELAPGVAHVAWTSSTARRRRCALDALARTHPIRAEVQNAERGDRELRRHHLREGRRGAADDRGLPRRGHVPRRHPPLHAPPSRGNAVADDLWRALDEASGQPMVELANGWIRQSGYPVIDLALEPTAAAVRLKQRRFFAEPGARRGFRAGLRPDGSCQSCSVTATPTA